MAYSDIGRPFGSSHVKLLRPLPLRHFCRTCMRLMCDKIIIAGIPVNVAPIRNYIRRYRKHHSIEDIDTLIYKLFETADFGFYTEEFGQELRSVLDRVFACPRCYVAIDREGSCEECGKRMTIKDNINVLEKLADKSRRGGVW
jgi:hypothetical protein